MKKLQDTKVMIIGGHLTPALAILQTLQDNGFKNIVWVGEQHSQTSSANTSAEYNILKQKEIKFISLTSGKIWRKWTLATLYKGIINLCKIPIGFIQSILILIKERPSIVLSFGGHLALPMSIAAKLAFTKVITHEQAVVPGLSSKIIAIFADKVLVSWEKTPLLNDKYIYTGNPIRREIFNSSTERFNFDNNLPIIYITGGNQGSNTINWRILEVIEKILTKANVVHQIGDSTNTDDFSNATERRNSLPDMLKKRYIIRKNIFGYEIGEIFQKADLVISRAGANTISEILALGKLSIVIPIPWSSGDEQQKNAVLLEKTGLSKTLKQYDDMPPKELYQAILDGLKLHHKKVGFNGKAISAIKKEARKHIKLEANILIYDEIEKTLKI